VIVAVAVVVAAVAAWAAWVYLSAPVSVTPPPAPNPPPTVLVQLLPHSFGDWLYISGATLIGAAVALLAAFIAWKAIEKQIAANAAQLQRQITANQANVDAQIVAEDKRRKRAERLPVVDEAITLVHEIFAWVGKGGRRGTEDAAKQQREALELRFAILIARLNLVEMTEEALLMNLYWSEAAKRAEPGASGGPELTAKYAEIMRALTGGIDG
jgi:hypothetical protein